MNSNIKLLKNYLLYFLLFIFICVIGISGVFALETKTIYSTNNSGTLQNSNKYIYGSDSSGSVGVGSVGSVVSGVSYGFQFYLYETILTTKTYTLVINFTDYDLLSSFANNWVNISSCSGSNCIDTVIVSVTKSNNSSNSNKLTISFNPVSAGSYLRVLLGSNSTPLEPLTSVVNFGISSVQIESTNASQDVIDNATNNTNNIINNNNSNTQDIINNQNKNTQEQIESQKVCTTYDYDSMVENNKRLDANGNLVNATGYYVSDYIDIKDGTLSITASSSSRNIYACYYYEDKSLDSCVNLRNVSGELSTYADIGVQYFRFTYSGGPTIKVCKNGNQALNDSINGLNDSLNDDDSSGATSEASEFFNSFNTSTFGLTSIITAPLNLIQSLTSKTCTPLHLPLPYLDNNYLDLPCMSTIYSEHFGAFFTIYQTITYGIIAYWVCVRIFNQVKDFKNPEHDEIEVVDL